MRRISLASAVLTMALIFGFCSVGEAAYLHYFSCAECHKVGTTIATLTGDNTCLQCHGEVPRDVLFNDNNTYTTPGSFALTDASDFAGSSSAAGVTPGQQTSHFWASKTDNMPLASAQAPVNALFYSRYNTSTGKITCTRCHNPHADSSTSGKKSLRLFDPLNPNRPIEEVSNDMCLDCHRGWNNSASHGLGTHPINMDYATAITKLENVGKYNDIASVTAATGDITLVAGKVGCTSCHGVHAVDSDATTTDGFGNILSIGDGLMLKHNGPAKEDVNDSICMACHKQEAHGTGPMALGCLTCHGGHNASDGPTANYYTLRKSIQLDASQTPDPSDSGTVTINLNYTEMTPDPQFNGACQVCHNNALPAGHLWGWDCASCHDHTSASGSFTPSCGSCHGNPPHIDIANGPDGYAVQPSAPVGFINGYKYLDDGTTLRSVYKNEATTPHLAHAGGGTNYAFSCQQCHSASFPIDIATHPNQSFQDVTFAGQLAVTGSLLSSYNPAVTAGNDGVCSNIYCHSNGGKRTDDGLRTYTVAVVPAWENGSTTGAISGCVACHNVPGATASAAHAAHITKGYSCSVCHKDTAVDATTLAAGAIGGKHVNGIHDVVFDATYSLGGATLGVASYPDALAGTCAVYCHSNGTTQAAADWDEPTSGDCGACHQVSSGGVATGTGIALNGAHAKHLYTADGGVQLACTVCHTHNGTDPDHVNGAPSMVANKQDVCNACHGALPGITSGNDREPIWTSTGSVDCQTCHVGALSVINFYTAPNKTQAVSSGHNLVSGMYASGRDAANRSCEDCHSKTAPGHFDGIHNDDTRLVGGFACTSCHTTKVSHQAKQCQDCHDPHGSSNWSMIYASQALQNAKDLSGTSGFGGDVVFLATSGENSYDEVDSGAVANLDDICATCHAALAHNNRTDTGTHLDGLTHEGENCFSCHKSHSDSPPFSGSASTCEGCHSNLATKGAHAAHMTVTPSIDADLSECAICHPSAATYTPAGGSADHFSNSANDFAAGITNPQVAGTTCSSTMGCHKSTVGDGSWQDVDGLNCNACHYEAVDPTQAGNTGDVNPLSAGHNAHFAAGGVAVCTDCHNTVADTSHISNAGGTDAAVLTDKANALQDEALINVAVGFNTTTNSCATASCHNNGRPGTSVPTSAWGSDDPNCSQCHLASPTTGSHAVHILDTNCSTCHTSALKDTSYISINHYDGNIDVAAGGYPTNKVVNTAFTNCSNASCHNDGRNSGLTQTWGTTLNACSECHATQPSTGSHSEHLAAGATCGSCHTGTTQGTTAGAGHRDTNIDTAAALGYTPNKTLGTAFTTCATASCHNNAQSSDGTAPGTVVVSPVWGNTAAVCGGCHSNSPTTAKHDEHLGTYGATCADCHLNAGTGVSMPTSNHLNGTIDVLASLNYNAAGVPGNGWGTCTNPNAGCHGTPEARPWDNSASSCNSCHGASGPTGAPLVGADMISTLSLGQHATHVTTQGYNCNVCHNGHGMPTLDNKITIAFTGMGTGGSYNPPALWTTGKWLYNQTSTTSTQDCSNLYCHSSVQANGGVNAPTYATANWGDPATGACGTCHLATPTTGSHTPHVNDGATCASCHSGNTHVNQLIDVTVGGYTSAGTPRNGYGSCITASCHDDGTGALVTTPLWGNTSACAECHAAAPDTGGHPGHLGVSFAGATIACASCHTGTVQGTTAGAGHRDGNIDAVGYATLNKTKGSAYTTCTTASCHQTGITANAYTTTAVWGANTANCTQCHLASPTTGSHIKHIASSDCSACHTGAVKDTSYAGAAHGDLNVDVSVGSYPANKALGSAYLSCSSVSCHSDGLSGLPGGTPVWGDSAGCAACHDSNMTTGSHTVHLADSNLCGNCHSGAVKDTTAPAQHTDGNVDVYVTAAGDLGYTQNAPIGSASWSTCSAASCHDKGRDGLAVTPTWGNTVSNCSECHANLPATGSHSAHVTAGSTCGDCHTGTVQGTTAPTTGHRDTNIDTAAGLGYTQNKVKDTAFTTCATASCHNDGRNSGLTATWGTTLNACSECHATQPSTGSHSEHLAAGATCGSCHTGTTQGTTAGAGHRDTNIDTAVALGYTPNKTLGTAFTTCATASCHNNAQSSDGTAPGTVVVSPVWGNTAAVCGGCHSNSPTTAKHDEHLGTYGATCADCHLNAGTGVSMPTSNHLNGTIDVLASLNYNAAGAPGNGWGTCTNPNAGCHGTSEARPWDNSASSCNSCHGASGATGAPLIGTDMMSTLPLGQHATHVTTQGYNCNICHNGHGMPTLDDKITITFTGMATGGSYNPPALWTTGKWLYNQTSTTSTQDCSNLYCHSSVQANGGVNAPTYTTAKWGDPATGACGTCHLATPTTGSHTPHVNDGATCAACHSGNTHVDQLIDVTVGAYTSAGAPRNGYGTCNTATCHDDGTGAPVTTPTWGSSSACAECHEAAPTTGGHPGHLGVSFAGATIACASCHTGTVQGTTAGAGHRDGNIDAVGYATLNKTKGTAYTTCTSASCHQTGITANAYTTTAVWGANTANCTQCHLASPTSGSHIKHIASNDCSSCHTGATKDTSYASAAHGDLNVDVSVGSYPANKALGSAYLSCSSVSCHSDGLSGLPGGTPVWGNSAGCSACHASNMTTGSHTVHLADSNLCGNCHSGAVKDTTAPAQHTDGNVDVYVTTAGDLGYTQNAPIGSASWSTCSAASCHDKGRAGLAVTPIWGNTVSDCSECHANLPATGSHSAHVTAGSTCGDCHTGTVQGTTAPTTGHRDTNIDTAAGLGYTQNKVKDTAFTTCATASCHNDGRNSGLTATWGTTLNACSECHATQPSTGSHSQHITAGATCGTCHTGTTQGTTAGAGHRDTNIDTAAALGYTPNKTLGTAFTTCSTASCHNDGMGLQKLSPTWGAVSDCSVCHATTPSTGSHGEHLAAGATCGQCHDGAVQGTTLPTQHADGNVDVFDVAAGDLGYPPNVAYGSGTWTTCSAASCHNNAQSGDADGGTTAGTVVVTPAWGNTAAVCGGCHSNSPTSAKHDEHLGTYGATCGDCHVNAGTGATLPTSNHLNGSIDVGNKSVYTAAGAPGNGWGTCTNIAVGCHPSTTRNWDASAAGCNSCHGYPPIPLDGKANIAVEGKGAHQKHVNHIALLASRTLEPTTDTFQGNVVCGVCHDVSTDTNHSTSGGPRNLLIPASYQFGTPTAPTYNGAVDESSSTNPKSCSSVSCHFRETPVWAPVGTE